MKSNQVHNKMCPFDTISYQSPFAFQIPGSFPKLSSQIQSQILTSRSYSIKHRIVNESRKGAISPWNRSVRRQHVQPIAILISTPWLNSEPQMSCISPRIAAMPLFTIVKSRERHLKPREPVAFVIL